MEADAGEYKAGDTVTFVATVANTGNIPLTRISVSDDLTGETKTLSDLAPGKQATVHFRYEIPKDAKTGTLDNHAQATANTSAKADTTRADADTSVQIKPGEAEAAIDLPASVRPGSVVKGTITVVNNGTRDLTGLKYSVEPEGAEVSGTVKRLKTGNSVTIQFEYDLAPYSAPRPLTMGVRISGTSGKEAVHLDAVTSVEVRHISALVAQQKASAQSVDPGKSIAYQVTLNNAGNTALTGLQCTTDLWGIAIDSKSVTPSDGTVIDEEALIIKRLEPGETASYEYTYPVSQSAEFGAFDNNFNVTGKDDFTGKAVTSNCVTTVKVAAKPAVRLRIATDKDSYSPGEAIRYTLTAENTGNVPLVDVRLRDLAQGLTLKNIIATDDEGATQATGEDAVILPEFSTGASLTAVFDGVAPNADLSESGVTATESRFAYKFENLAAVYGKSAEDGSVVRGGARAAVTVEGDLALAMEASSDAEAFEQGETARVRVKVINNSEAIVRHIVIENDQGFAFSGKNRAVIDVSDSGGNAIIAGLEPGEDVTLTFEKAIPADSGLTGLDIDFTARSAYVSASATLPIAVGKAKAPLLAAISAVEPTVEAGENALFQISLTNESDGMLYSLEVTVTPEGGTFANLPEGATLEGNAVCVDQLPAGGSLKLDYQVPTATGDETGKSLEAVVTASGLNASEQGDTLTASANASVVLQKPALTPTPVPTGAPAPMNLPVNVLIIGIAALALILAGGLVWLARRRNKP